MAHGMRLDHPIFRQPLQPNLELVSIDTPEQYRHWPGGRELGPQIEAWKVHDGTFPEIDVGLVSDPYGFEDTPDAEWISGGLNSKGPGSVALGRVGNFFHWGFFGDPSLMTESAKEVFVNTICWMAQFDGQQPILRWKSGQARDWALVYVGYVHEMGDSDNVFTTYSSEGTIERTAQEFLRDLFPADVLEDAGQGPGKLDADLLENYFLANLEYLMPGEKGMVVDEDVRSLGVSNRKPEFLTVLADRLEQDPADPIALRCAERYLPESAASGAELVLWLRENTDRLYFSDVGGFRWFERPDGISPRAIEVLAAPVQEELFPHEPSNSNPVVAAASIEPVAVEPGGEFTYTVHVRTAPTWHIYPADAGPSPNSPTVLQLILPEGIETVGDWEQPEVRRDPLSGSAVLEGEFEFRQKLRMDSAADGEARKIRCVISYQCCDPFRCLPPAALEVAAELAAAAQR